MSIPRAKALGLAESFRDLHFGEAPYAAWQVAGSLRRGKSEVKDIEHVIRVKGLIGGPEHEALLRTIDGLLPADGLFSSPKSGTIEQAVYGEDQRKRWGRRYRGLIYPAGSGIKHELFFTDEDNFGAMVLIRTGPAEFSQQAVITLRERGMHMEGGYVRDADACIVTVPDEQRMFDLLGWPWTEPENRHAAPP